MQKKTSNNYESQEIIKALKDDCHVKQQNITFIGSGSHHQNGVAEHSIQTIFGRARTLLLHAAIN